MAFLQAKQISGKASTSRRCVVVRAGNGVTTKEAPAVAGLKIALPQKDSDAAGRASRLAAQRALLEFDHEFLPGAAIAKVVPQVESFSPIYNMERYKLQERLGPNAFAAMARGKDDPLDEFQDFEDFFQTIPLPAVAKVYQTDESFAEQRLSGANPHAIKILGKSDPRGDVIRSLDLGFDVKSEIEKRHIYLCDYTGTDPAYRGPSKVKGAVGEYLPKPLVFYRHTKETGLLPIAIQIIGSADGNTYKLSTERVYTPTEKAPTDWLFAKFCAQIADANHHEMCTHLARCHFTMEPIAVSTGRQLEYSHPLSILLRAHMRFIMANNLLAHNTFFNKADSTLEALLPGTFNEIIDLVVESYDSWDLKKQSFQKDLADRGLADRKQLPHFPYRDDGELLWDAIHNYVKAYLRHFYPDNASVQKDAELQAWAKELSSPNEGGRVKGMPDDIDTLAELIEIVSTIIFNCGPMHSAVNFAQSEYIAFAANLPLSAYSDIQVLARQTEPVTEQQILKMLPPAAKCLQQLNTILAIATYHYDTLGYYDKTFAEMYQKTTEQVFADHKPILEAIKNFQDELKEAEAIIDERNKTRKVPYPFLRPSEVMNSVSI